MENTIKRLREEIRAIDENIRGIDKTISEEGIGSYTTYLHLLTIKNRLVDDKDMKLKELNRVLDEKASKLDEVDSNKFSPEDIIHIMGAYLNGEEEEESLSDIGVEGHKHIGCELNCSVAPKGMINSLISMGIPSEVNGHKHTGRVEGLKELCERHNIKVIELKDLGIEKENKREGSISIKEALDRFNNEMVNQRELERGAVGKKAKLQLEDEVGIMPISIFDYINQIMTHNSKNRGFDEPINYINREEIEDEIGIVPFGIMPDDYYSEMAKANVGCRTSEGAVKFILSNEPIEDKESLVNYVNKDEIVGCKRYEEVKENSNATKSLMGHLITNMGYMETGAVSNKKKLQIINEGIKNGNIVIKVIDKR